MTTKSFRDFGIELAEGLDKVLISSFAVQDYLNPEGIVIYHKASGQLFKKTIKNDEQPKGVKNA